jgi:FkbM family methyltransferase
MNLLPLANKIYNRLTRSHVKISFSQCGEDILLHFLISALKMKKVLYFDIGTNDPRTGNNTYLLYLNGYRGVCVEPNPYFHKKIEKLRPEDILIRGGLALESAAEADFYLMDDSVLSTFSLEEAETMQREQQRILAGKIKVPLFQINDIFDQYHIAGHDMVLSIDVEGLDLDILESIDFSVYQPAIICVETVEFSTNLTGKKRTAIFDLLYSKNYKLYADTYINSIFILKSS